MICWFWFPNFTKLIFFAVYPRVSLHPGPHYAIDGKSYTLPVCQVTGYPTPLVSWRKSAGQLPQERMKYSKTNRLHVGNVGTARKVFPHWSQKTIAHHCLSLPPIVSRLGYRTNWPLGLGDLLHDPQNLPPLWDKVCGILFKVTKRFKV